MADRRWLLGAWPSSARSRPAGRGHPARPTAAAVACCRSASPRPPATSWRSAPCWPVCRAAGRTRPGRSPRLANAHAYVPVPRGGHVCPGDGDGLPVEALPPTWGRHCTHRRSLYRCAAPPALSAGLLVERRFRPACGQPGRRSLWGALAVLAAGVAPGVAATPAAMLAVCAWGGGVLMAVAFRRPTPARRARPPWRSWCPSTKWSPSTSPATCRSRLDEEGGRLKRC